MASVLAVISRAVVGELMPSEGGLGLILPFERYVSRQKVLQAVTAGGALFLVTLRPERERLWLVAVLERPTFDGEAWRAAPNQIPITDVTNTVRRLRFSAVTRDRAPDSGAEPAAAPEPRPPARPGALFSSLQTPRMLTAEDEALLRRVARTAVRAQKKRTAAPA